MKRRVRILRGQQVHTSVTVHTAGIVSLSLPVGVEIGDLVQINSHGEVCGVQFATAGGQRYRVLAINSATEVSVQAVP